MSTRLHRAAIDLPVPPQEAFAYLVTPSAIRGWWSASRVVVLPGQGGVWAAAWGESEDDPDYVTAATISVYEPPRRLVMSDYRYHAREGALPFDADFVTEFLLEPTAEGCRLQVTQDGFPAGPEADAFYAACESGWEDTLAALLGFAEARRR